MRYTHLDQVYYFSYGHNTHTATMRERCPGAHLMGPAVLYNFRLSFEKFANIEHDEGAVTHGVLYEMPRSDLRKLDQDERFKEHYTRIPVEVHHAHDTQRAFVYIMEPSWHPGDYPTPEYLHDVTQGYVQHGLPLSQIDQALKRKNQDVTGSPYT